VYRGIPVPGNERVRVVTPPITAVLLARNAARNFLGIGIPLLVALVSMPLLVGRLDTARFGVLGLVWVVFGLFAELGLGRATTRFAASSLAAGSAGEARRILRIGVGVQLALGLLSGAVLLLAAPVVVARLGGGAGIEDEFRAVLYVVAAGIPVVMMSAAYRGILEAAHRFDIVNRVRIPVASATYALPAIVVVLGGGLVAIVLLLAAVRALGTLVYAWSSSAVIGDGRTHARAGGPGVVDILKFGAWQTTGGVLAPLLVYLDRFLLGALAGVAAVGLYTPAFEVALRLLILPVSVVMALFPAFSAWSASLEAERSARAAARAVLYIVAGIAPMVAILAILGEDGLRLWLNAEYARESGTVLTILAFGVLLNGTAFVPATLLAGAGRPDIPPKLYLLELPVYVVLATVLITHWGLVGAATAWTCRVTVDALLLFLAAHRLALLRWQELWRMRAPQTLAGVCVCLMVPTVAAATLPGLWLRIGLAVVALAATMAFLWLYALRADGRAQLAAVLGMASA
jgi:O-antigen/teichoic acid export membrane protein